MRWLGGDRLFHGAAGSRAHRRARRRPGLLADAAGRAAAGQPRRPVRRGRDRLLRHLRGVAAVVGARRAARCASAARRWSTRTPSLSMVSEVSTSFLESGLLDDAGQRRRGGARRAVGPAGRRHQRHAGAGCERRARQRAAGQRVLRTADPGRLHRRRRPAELGAVARAARTARVHVRRRAPPGGAVLRRHGHQRARQGPGAARSDAAGGRPLVRAPPRLPS
ncbi:MAG: hypothetical protein MZW92_36690 [Comamonadaceae bacterium]|nr:hypothetical protein [Comamonadaceae bacterium]